MTNLYVSGSSIGTYADITSSNTLINANKVENSFKKIYRNDTIVGTVPQVMYLDINNNLYGDINCTNLIASDVDDIRPGTYLKDNKIYRVWDNFVMAEQVKEYTLGNMNKTAAISYIDVNNKHCYKDFRAYYETTPLYNITRDEYIISFCWNKYGYIYLDNEGTLFYNTDATRVTISEIYEDVKEIIPGYRAVSSGEYGTLFITNAGEVKRFRKTATYNPSIDDPHLLNEDERIVYALPTEYSLNAAFYDEYAYYLFKTNTNRVITNYNRATGIDPVYIKQLEIPTTTATFAITSLIEYPVTIYNKDNETIAATGNVLPVIYASISVEDTTAILTLYTATDTSYNIAFTIEQPKGYGFAGLSLIPNATEPDITLEGNIFISAQPLQLYQVYQKALPPDAVQATLYFNSSEPNRINKRNFLTKYKDIVGVFRSSVSIEDPVLVLELNEFPSFNYVYIKNFNRYYFVRGRDNISKNIYSLTLHVDPLYSFMNEIGDNTAILSRTSNISLQSPNLVDNKLPIQNNEEIEVIYEEEMDPPIFNIDNTTWNNVYRYVLTCFSAKDLVPVSEQQQ